MASILLSHIGPTGVLGLLLHCLILSPPFLYVESKDGERFSTSRTRPSRKVHLSPPGEHSQDLVLVCVSLWIVVPEVC